MAGRTNFPAIQVALLASNLLIFHAETDESIMIQPFRHGSYRSPLRFFEPQNLQSLSEPTVAKKDGTTAIAWEWKHLVSTHPL
jgi:hypothetical protein